MWLGLLGCSTDSSRSTSPMSERDRLRLLASENYLKIRTAARTDARADIKADHPRICYAGTIGVFAVGVPEHYLKQVQVLPRVPLPCGCTEPLAHPAYAYAEAYNDEIVRYLRA